MTIYVERRGIVAPGELLAEGRHLPGANTYAVNGKIRASKLGLVEFFQNKVSVVPLKGCYIPNLNDQVIGKIMEVEVFGWIVDIASPYRGLLPASEVHGRRSQIKLDLTKIFDIGDLILAKVVAFDRTRDPLLTVKGRGLGKISSGKIIKISPAKIPRLIGKKGSMINMLKKEAGCEIYVGQNGLILISGKSPFHERLVVEAVRKIEREAHTQGLTDRVKEMLVKKKREVK